MNKTRKHSILALAALLLVSTLCLTACTKKRCLCITERKLHQTTRAYEDLGDHKNCSELNKEWQASDQTAHMINKTCTPAPEE